MRSENLAKSPANTNYSGGTSACIAYPMALMKSPIILVLDNIEQSIIITPRSSYVDLLEISDPVEWSCSFKPSQVLRRDLAGYNLAISGYSYIHYHFFLRLPKNYLSSLSSSVMGLNMFLQESTSLFLARPTCLLWMSKQAQYLLKKPSPMMTWQWPVIDSMQKSQSASSPSWTHRWVQASLSTVNFCLFMWMLRVGRVSKSLTLQRRSENMGANGYLQNPQRLTPLLNCSRIRFANLLGMETQELPVSSKADVSAKWMPSAICTESILMTQEWLLWMGTCTSWPSNLDQSGSPKVMEEDLLFWKLRLTPKAYLLMILLLMRVCMKVGLGFLASVGKESPTNPCGFSKFFGAQQATRIFSLNWCLPNSMLASLRQVCRVPSRYEMEYCLFWSLQTGQEYFLSGLPLESSPLMKISLDPVSMLRLQGMPQTVMLRVKKQPMELMPWVQELADRWRAC